MNDHVNGNVRGGKAREHFGGNAGHVGHAAQGNFDFRGVMGNAGNNGFFHIFRSFHNIGALGVGESRARMDNHVEFAGKLYGAALQNA